jgi:hypothetical protein
MRLKEKQQTEAENNSWDERKSKQVKPVTVHDNVK